MLPQILLMDYSIWISYCQLNCPGILQILGRFLSFLLPFQLLLPAPRGAALAVFAGELEYDGAEH